jgi:hypothetical protein
MPKLPWPPAPPAATAPRELSLPRMPDLGSRSVYLRATPAQTEKVSGTSMAGRQFWT